MSADIRTVVQKCATCEEFRRVPREPLLPTSLPERPWWRLATDYFEWKGSSYLVVVDYFSRYILCKKMKDMSANTLVSTFDEWFSMFGTPHTLMSDNGSQLKSEKFESFLKKRGIVHTTSSPGYPQSNGEAERAVQTVKALLNKNDNLHRALAAHRDSPLASGYSPAQLLFGRPMHTMGVSSRKPIDMNKVIQYGQQTVLQQKQTFDKNHRVINRQPFEIGEHVKVKDSSGVRHGTVVETNGRELLIGGSGQTLRRNRALVVRTDQRNETVEPTKMHTTQSTLYNDPVGSTQPAPNKMPVNIKYSNRSGRPIKPRERLDL